MTRQARSYTEVPRRLPLPPAVGADVSEPEAGFFRYRLGQDTVRVGVEIRFGPPLDPITGEPLDRSWRWMAFVNGAFFADWNRVWPACTGEPITEQEYRRFCARQDWARQRAPDSAYAEPGRKLDPLAASTPLPF